MGAWADKRILQSTFENYTQTANFGIDQSFQMYTEQADPDDILNPAKM